MSVSIPARFRDELALHLVRNFRPSPSASTPLILGIHGPAGDGKTYQTEKSLELAKVQPFLISGGQLESGTAGEPAALVRTTYLSAGVRIANRQPAALLLNDADAAIGSWGDMTQYTVNTQNVITELMHLADYPTVVEGRPTPRVPIIITGNDFTRLYGPLCRPGRMELFEWTPTPYERTAVVATIFPELAEADIAFLLKGNPDRPISFWSSVRSRLQRETILRVLKRQSLSDVLVHLLRNGDIRLDNVDIDLEAVRETVESVLANYNTAHLQAARSRASNG